jgi:hypothetical protein
MPGSDSKISVTGFGERSHAAAANRVRDETRGDTAGDAAVAGRAGGLVDHPGAGEGRVNRE